MIDQQPCASEDPSTASDPWPTDCTWPGSDTPDYASATGGDGRSGMSIEPAVRLLPTLTVTPTPRTRSDKEHGPDGQQVRSRRSASATEFKSRSATSPGCTSFNSRKGRRASDG